MDTQLACTRNDEPGNQPSQLNLSSTFQTNRVRLLSRPLSAPRTTRAWSASASRPTSNHHSERSSASQRLTSACQLKQRPKTTASIQSGQRKRNNYEDQAQKLEPQSEEVHHYQSHDPSQATTRQKSSLTDEKLKREFREPGEDLNGESPMPKELRTDSALSLMWYNLHENGTTSLGNTFSHVDPLRTGFVPLDTFISVLVRFGMESESATQIGHIFGSISKKNERDSSVNWIEWLKSVQHSSDKNLQTKRKNGEQNAINNERKKYSVEQVLSLLHLRYNKNPVAFRQLFRNLDDDRDMELTQVQIREFVQKIIPDICENSLDAFIHTLPFSNTYPTGVAPVFFQHLRVVYRQFVQRILSSTISLENSNTPSLEPRSRCSTVEAQNLSALLSPRSLQASQHSAMSLQERTQHMHSTHHSSHPNSVLSDDRRRIQSAESVMRNGHASAYKSTHPRISNHSSRQSQRIANVKPTSSQQQRALSSMHLLEVDQLDKPVLIRSLKAKGPTQINLVPSRSLLSLSIEEQNAFVSNKPGAGLSLCQGFAEPIRVRDSEKKMRDLAAMSRDAFIQECQKCDPHHTGVIPTHAVNRILTENFDLNFSKMAFEHVCHVADCSMDTGIPYIEFIGTFESQLADIFRSSVFIGSSRPVQAETTDRWTLKTVSNSSNQMAPPVADIHEAIKDVMCKCWKQFFRECKKMDALRHGWITTKQFDTLLTRFGVELNDDQFKRLGYHWRVPKSKKGLGVIPGCLFHPELFLRREILLINNQPAGHQKKNRVRVTSAPA
eukprot:gene7043-415_t